MKTTTETKRTSGIEGISNTLEQRLQQPPHFLPEIDIKILQQGELCIHQVNETGKDEYHAISGTDLVNYILNLKKENEDLKQQNRLLGEKTLTDPLTGAYNRRFLEDYLGKATSRADRTGQYFTALMCDIDHFKNINDTYGHEEGDRILKQVVNILQDYIRKEDCVVRYGGEEFVVFLEGADIENLPSRIDKLRQKIADEVRTKDNTPVTISIGGASYSHKGEDVLGKADEMLYMAKHEGRNCARLLFGDRIYTNALDYREAA